MTRERIIELLDLVLICNERHKEKDITVSLNVSAFHVEVHIFFHDMDALEEDGVDMYSYTNDAGTDRLVDGIRTLYDPKLVKAERHIRRLIDDVDR